MLIIFPNSLETVLLEVPDYPGPCDEILITEENLKQAVNPVMRIRMVGKTLHVEHACSLNQGFAEEDTKYPAFKATIL